MPMQWDKKGLLITPYIDGFSFAAVGCAIHLNENTWLLAFTRRDTLNRSHIFTTRIEAHDGKLSICEEELHALSPGEPGLFDDAGVMTSCFSRINNHILLYYTGWELRQSTPFSFSVGAASWTEGNSLIRVSPAPLLGRHKNAPIFQAAPSIMSTGRDFRMWFVTGIGWDQDSSGNNHYITNICHARSKDGLSWEPEPEPLLSASHGEYAFGRPCVNKTDEYFEMWYCHRGSIDCPTYRIGYAISHDGIKWQRRDDEANLLPSDTGWDCDMVCYPHVFSHKGWDYMLYNGNGFGITGLGYASRRI